MATQDHSRHPTAPSKLACARRNRAAKAAWWETAERIDRLGDLISDIPHAQVSGREVIQKLRTASADLDRAIIELSTVKALTEVQS